MYKMFYGENLFFTFTKNLCCSRFYFLRRGAFCCPLLLHMLQGESCGECLKCSFQLSCLYYAKFFGDILEYAAAALGIFN